MIKTPKTATSIAYWELISRQKSVDDKYRYKWETVLNHEIMDKEWQTAYKNVCWLTLSTKLRTFQYKLLNWAIVTNKNLHCWKLRDTPFCSFCNNEVETYVHMFVECRVVQDKLWIPLKKWLDYFCYIQIDNKDGYAIIMNKYKDSFPQLVNTIILIAKYHIYVKRCLNEKINFTEFIGNVTQYKMLERVIAKRRNKLDKHNKKWLMYDKV